MQFDRYTITFSPAHPPPAASTATRSVVSARELEASDPHSFAGVRAAALQPGVGTSVRVLPFNRAKFLAGARFDLRIEPTGVDPATARIEIAVSGPNGPVPLLQGGPIRTSSAADSLEVTYSGLWYDQPGAYSVSASATSGGQSVQSSANHEVVVAAPSGKKAKNVSFFLGDGMGAAPITAARILSKGMTEGKYHGLLEMDRMDYRGLVTTSGGDAIATDSANSMSAYMTGHKASVNAMGVYEANDPDTDKHPRVETMAELLKRTRGMAIGVVTTSEVQDATPAAVWAHTRRRAEYPAIMDQALNTRRARADRQRGSWRTERLRADGRPGRRRSAEHRLGPWGRSSKRSTE